MTWVASPPSSRIIFGCHDSAEIVLSMHHLKTIEGKVHLYTKQLPEVFLALPSPSKDWYSSLSKSSSYLILGRVDVASGPAHLRGVGALTTKMNDISYLCAKAAQRLHKDCSLGIDVGATHYPCLLQWLVFLCLVPKNYV